MKNFFRIWLFSIFWGAGMLSAQNFANGFIFNLPAQDTTTQPFLPYFPKQAIGNEAFVAINPDGHFSVAGQLIRFWGTNAVADGAFPTKTKAWFIAGRLRKMGFNLVRFHHIDNPWGAGSLFVPGQDTRHLNPTTLDRLEKFISELKKNGIYVNMNLHVSRTFNARDGVPDADSILNYGKGVTYFDPQLIQLQKEYARQLLTHVNPYTHLALVDDPVLALVEIINENSLYRLWRDDKLKPFAQGGDLTVRHHEMLNDLWLDFLTQKYGNSDSLRRAWSQGERTAGDDDQIFDSGFERDPQLKKWQLELHDTARGVMGIETTNPFAGNFAARVAVTQSDGVSWHIQWKQINLKIEQDSLYTIQFAGRAMANRPIAISVMNDNSPWTGFFSTAFLLTPAWQTFQFSFRAPETCSSTRLAFQLGSETGTYWFDEIHFTSAATQGLAADESLEDGTVRRIDFSECSAISDVRVMDQSEFYFKIERDFQTEMFDFLKNELKVKVPLVGTNWNIGPADWLIQSEMDFLDNHAYWDHPQFPGIPWDAQNWLIENTPMVRSATGGTIPALLGGVGFMGKPLTVSEYNHPFPNRYQSECVLFLAAYAAFHQADGLMFFDYGGSSDNWETDQVAGFFNIHRNTSLMALMPACAKAYREGYISPAQQTILLNYSRGQLLLLPKNDSRHWLGPETFPRELALQHAVRSATFDSPVALDVSVLPATPTNPFTTDTGEISWNTNGLLQVATPGFIALTGFLNAFPRQPVGDLTLITGSGFGTVTWVTLSGKSLNTAERSLITVSARLQNTSMKWDGSQTVHNQWGSAPTQMEPLTLKLQLALPADSIRIFPLDPLGATQQAFFRYLPVAENLFEITLDQNQTRTVWFGVECFGLKSSVPAGKSLPLRFQLGQNYPNPFYVHGQSVQTTQITYLLPVAGNIRLIVYDVLGRTVRVLIDQHHAAGEYKLAWDGRDTAGNPAEAGVYFYRIESSISGQRYNQTKKMVVLK